MPPTLSGRPVMNFIAALSGAIFCITAPARGPCSAMQRAVEHRLDLAAVVEVGLQVREVLVLARGVDHHDEVIRVVALAGPGHHQVVEDAAGIVGEEGVALLPRREALEIRGAQPLQRARDLREAFAAQADLAHVRDVEQAGAAARVLMLGEDAHGVLHRHVVAGERHHLAAELDMQIVEGSSLQGFGARTRAHRQPPGWDHGKFRDPQPPSVFRT